MGGGLLTCCFLRAHPELLGQSLRRGWGILAHVQSHSRTAHQQRGQAARPQLLHPLAVVRNPALCIPVLTWEVGRVPISEGFPEMLPVKCLSAS